MTPHAVTPATVPTSYRSVQVDGLNIAYREAGDPGNPKLVLLHGFPASSHQYRDLIPALAARFHVIAPDYPGFGNSDMPDPAVFGYTFDRLSEITEAFLESQGLRSLRPVRAGLRRPGRIPHRDAPPGGARLADHSEHERLRSRLHQRVGRLPRRAVEEPLAGDRKAAGRLPRARRDQGHLPALGAQNPELISPDNWESDFGFMQRPNAERVQLDLFYDYRTNVELYPKWQAFLRERQPKTIIFWGQDDIFFTPEGGEAYLARSPEGRDAPPRRRPLRGRGLAQRNRRGHAPLLRHSRRRPRALAPTD